MISFPEKKYSIIYADPPWKYNDSANAGRRGACHKYQVMNLQDICELPVKDIASENCTLFMWVTYPFLDSFLQVVNAWGFTYKTVAFTWVKQNSTGKYPIGMGRWTRANPEICILATKGKPKRISAAVRNLQFAPVRKHSQKPDSIRNEIVRLCGELPRLELFARLKVDGWDCWGNEI